jgi:hypothetical protein
MRLMPGRAGELPARLKSAWARLARPVLGLFRLGLPRCRRPDDRHDGANLLSRHVAEVRRQLQCVVCLACNIMHERPVDNFSVIFPEGTDGRFDSWHLRHTSPTKGPLLPDPSRSFPFGWGFHFLPWAAGPGEDAATKDPRTYFGLSFPAAVAPTIPMTVPRAITSAPVVPVTVPAPLRLSAGADIRRSRRSCRRSRRSRPGSSPAFAALEMTGVPLWSHGRAR